MSTWRKRNGSGQALAVTLTDFPRMHCNWYLVTTQLISLMQYGFLEYSSLKHVTAISAKCFFQLRQLRRVRRSLDDESAATLVYAFVTSRRDYYNSLLAGAPNTVTDKLQRVMNSAAHRHEHTEVRPQFNARSTWYPSLARCTRTCHIQAMHDRLQVSGMGPLCLSEMCRSADLVEGWLSSLASADH